MSLNLPMIAENNPALYRNLCDRWEDEAKPGDTLNMRFAHKFQETEPLEAFREYLEYNGIIGYDKDIREALWTLISSSDKYLTTTDHAREEWLKDLLGINS